MVEQNKKSVTLNKEQNAMHLDYEALRKVALIVRAINHKLRQRIIELLANSELMTVTQIYIKLRLEQSVASQHLAILRRAGVVDTIREGKYIYYSLNKERLDDIFRLTNELVAQD